MKESDGRAEKLGTVKRGSRYPHATGSVLGPHAYWAYPTTVAGPPPTLILLPVTLSDPFRVGVFKAEPVP